MTYNKQLMTINKRGLALSRVEGFTLIEMLVVIAVVGILSAAVLTALGPARNKAKDSRIISAINQVRAVAETLYDGDYGVLPSGAVVETEANFGRLAKDINSNQGELNINLAGDSLSYSAYSKLASDSSKYYCVDSAGNTEELSSAPTGPACQ